MKVRVLEGGDSLELPPRPKGWLLGVHFCFSDIEDPVKGDANLLADPFWAEYGETLLGLLLMPAAWCVFRFAGDAVGVASKDDCFHIWPQESNEPGLPIPDGLVRKTSTGWAGDGWTLDPHPLVTRGPHRGFASTMGGWPGNTLRVYHQRSAEDGLAWLEGHSPLPWRRSPLLTAPPQTRWYTFVYRRVDPSGTRTGVLSEIVLGPGTVTFWESSRWAPLVSALLPPLLLELADGALGPITWDAWDDDYWTIFATGESGVSLREHLDPAVDEAMLRARYQEATNRRQAFSLHEFIDHAAIVAALARELPGAPETPSEFRDWLRCTSLDQLPRYWSIGLHDDADLEHLVEFLLECQPRLKLNVRRGPVDTPLGFPTVLPP